MSASGFLPLLSVAITVHLIALGLAVRAEVLRRRFKQKWGEDV